MAETHELSAAELARRIRDRKITPMEVAQTFLERIDASGTQSRCLGPGRS